MTRRFLAAALLAALAAPARGDEPPEYRIELMERTACATPSRSGQARADDGTIDVRTTADDTLQVRMTGAASAISYLGCTSSASECFRLTQVFEVSCSDPKVRDVELTVESMLAGYLSTARKAGARMRLASATVRPESWDSSSLVVAHEPQGASGGGAHQCNQNVPPIKGPPMPLGRFVLVADFTIDASAGGICNARAMADFSPDAKMPSDWAKTVDPFPNAGKKDFGFAVIVRASAPSGPTPAPLPPVEARPGPFLPPVPSAPPVAPPGSDPKPLSRAASPRASDVRLTSGARASSHR